MVFRSSKLCVCPSLVSTTVVLCAFCSFVKSPSLHGVCLNGWSRVWGRVWLRELVRWWLHLQRYGIQKENQFGRKDNAVFSRKECSRRMAVQRFSAETCVPVHTMPCRALWVGRLSLSPNPGPRHFHVQDPDPSAGDCLGEILWDPLP